MNQNIIENNTNLYNPLESDIGNVGLLKYDKKYDSNRQVIYYY